METLLLVSDIEGFSDEDRAEGWITAYVRELEQEYTIRMLDSRRLAGMDTRRYRPREEVHTRLVNGGIELAAAQLCRRYGQPARAIGFSVGGTILWRAARTQPFLQKLVCLSSTRLRLEDAGPCIRPLLFFGRQDAFRPGNDWLIRQHADVKLTDGAHNVYRDPAFIQEQIETIRTYLRP